MRIRLKSMEEIKLQREACLVVAEILDELEAAARPGVSTWELDQIAARGIARAKVESLYLFMLREKKRAASGT